MKIRMMEKIAVARWLALSLVAVALVAGACGSNDDEGTTTGEVPEIADADDGLPLADGDAAPLDEGPCVEGEPDCEEILVDTPVPQGGEVASSGMTVDGGLSIAEALSTEAAGIVAVHGHLFDDGSGFRLCEHLVGLGERYGCDGDQIKVSNVAIEAVPNVVFLEGTTYTEDEITLFGELVDGALVIDPLVAG